MPNTAPPADDNTKTPPHYLMWFRRDLRIADNTALADLCQRAQDEQAQVSALFFITPEQWQQHDTAILQVDLISRTLPILAKDLQEQLNITLSIAVCPSFDECVDALSTLCQSANISCVMANHEYEENEISRDSALADRFAKQEIDFIRHHDQCILPPQSITTNDDSMYQIFTPFYKKWRQTVDAASIESHQAAAVDTSHSLAELLASDYPSADNSSGIKKLTEQVLKDYQKQCANQTNLTHIDIEVQLESAREAYPAGEDAANKRLKDFVADDIKDYDVSRDVPSYHATSQLSAYLTIGAISARVCYLQAAKAQDKLHGNDGDNDDINRWISELAWRDFYRHVLSDKPELIRHKAYKEDVDKTIDWSYNEEDFAAWRMGKTGVPLVDAAMRCLNATGFMHNRLRMVTAMFLTKDLLIDWRWGERYFMQNLIDGDFASNNGGWQWSASTGTDAAPYFRIMNPFSQGKSHDKDAVFIKQWLPELADIPASTLHSEAKLRKALDSNEKNSGKNDKKGEHKDKQAVTINYPAPIVEHKIARAAAIHEFKK